MKNDPIVEEVRRTRQRILAECDGDLDRLIDRLKAGDAKRGKRLVSVEEVRDRARTPKTAT